MGQIAYIDLNTQKTVIDPPSPRFYETYLGSRGTADRILWDKLPPNISPFDPANVLIISTGPFTGTLWPCSARYTVTAKSPQTLGLGYANAGGFFAPALKFAGFDALVITGKSPQPVWMEARDNEIILHSAKKLWGCLTNETEDRVIEQTGDDKTKVLTIGPAGENLIRYAAIINDYSHAAGRTGMGAVMGSKNLKAIAVHGEQDIRIHDLDAFIPLAKNAIQLAADSPLLDWFRLYGKASLVGIEQHKAGLPTKNRQLGQFPGFAEISGEYIREHYRIKDRACFGCPVRCTKVTTVNTGKYRGLVDEVVEYE